MSMDETYMELQRFASQLKQFNDSLTMSVKALTQKHEAISDLWRDSFRKNYDQQWSEFSRQMERYRSADADLYEEFLKMKIQQLGGYLGND